MAHANPIVVQPSSAAAHFELSPRRAAPKPAASSSPLLPSPTTFFRPATSGLGGTLDVPKAQSAVATAGVTTAASPRQTTHPDATVEDGVGPACGGAVGKGKLRQPRKRAKKSESIVVDSDEPELSAYFVRPGSAESPLKVATAPDAALEDAEKLPAAVSRRRRSWTPAEDTAIGAPSPPSRVPLSELLGNFSYASLASAASPSHGRVAAGEAMTKRRKIELAEGATVSALSRQPGKKKGEKVTVGSELPPPKPPKRAKSPKKKPQTITALATAAYQPPKEPEPEQGTVSGFFAPRPEDTTAATTTTERPVTAPAKVKKPRKSRSKAAEGAISNTDTTKQKAASRPKKGKAKVRFNEADLLSPLYSPEKATAQMQRQDFLFGTSSQLAADESPTLIKEMQAAMAASAYSVPGTQAASPHKKSCAKIPSAPHGTSLSVGQAERELWCSAARDFKGGLHRDKSGLSKPKTRAVEQETQIIETGPAPACLADPPASSVHARHNSEKATAKAGLAKFVDIDETNDSEKATANTEPNEVGVGEINEYGKAPANAGSDEFVDIDEINAYSKNTASAESDNFVDIDEIYDSDPAPPTPSPPRRRASAPPSPVQPLAFEMSGSPSKPTTTALAAAGMLKSTDAQWPAIHDALFPQITSTVKNAPRSTSHLSPSWHEKILLYDPIVLEDFTAWLNSHNICVAVQRKIPKKRSRSRPKKDEGMEQDALEIETIQEALQPWMVQKWCEEKSICCLWKEGLRGGVRTKY